MNYKEILNSWGRKLGYAGAGAILAAGVLLIGECRDFRASTKDAAVATVAPPTKAEAKAPPIVLPCRDVKAINPAPKERARLAEKYNRPDIAALAREFEAGATAPVRTEILGERTLPRLPEGGTALLTLTPEGHVDLTVAPLPAKLWEWRSVYEAGALYGIGTAGDTRGRAWVAVEPVRFARLHLRGEAGVDLRAGQTDGYALAGVVWRSR